MITGFIKSDEARIRLKVMGRRGREQEVEAIIDSGYSGALTLPPALIAMLGLRWRSVDRATLADGSTCRTIGVSSVFPRKRLVSVHGRRRSSMPIKRMAGLLTAKQALLAANRYILFHYPTMYAGALPRRLALSNLDVWAVPIVLTHPDHGVVGDVGLLAVDAASGEVVGATPRSEVARGNRGGTGTFWFPLLPCAGRRCKPTSLARHQRVRPSKTERAGFARRRGLLHLRGPRQRLVPCGPQSWRGSPGSGRAAIPAGRGSTRLRQQEGPILFALVSS